MSPQGRDRIARAGLSFFLSFLLFSFAGCIGPDARDDMAAACAELPADLTVDAVYETSLLVDGRSLVLHASKATILLRTGPGECQTIELADVRAGDRAGHNANEVAMSYPAQAWPAMIIIDRT